MAVEDEHEKRGAGGDQIGRNYGSLIEYPTDAPAQAGEDAGTLTLEDEAAVVDHKLSITSTEAGVYLLRDRAGKVLYVGKAKSLRQIGRAHV